MSRETKKKAGRKNWKFAITLQYGHFWERALACSVLQGLALFGSDMLTGSLQGVWTTGQSSVRPQAKPPEPRPCPYYSHSQSICAQCQQLTHWIHRGAVCSTCGLYPQTSCWPGCSSWQANTHIYALALKDHFIKLLETLVERKAVCWGRATQIKTHMYFWSTTTTGISVRL